MQIAIIGAGPGGLSAGMILAYHGFNVTIYEKKNDVGGRNSYLTDNNAKYRFDIGPTFLVMPFILEDIFYQCNKSLYDYLELKLLDPYYKIDFGDGTELHLGHNLKRVIENIKEYNLNDVEGFKKYLYDNEQKFNKVFPFLRKDYQNSIINWDSLKLFFIGKTYMSLKKDLIRYFQDDRLITGFSLIHKYLGISSEKCPALYSILPYMEFSSGIYHVIGGLNQISKAMATVFKQLGGNLKLNSEVSNINIQNGKATGLTLKDGSIVDYDEIIMNADFTNGLSNLVSNSKRSKYTDNKLEKMDHSYSNFTLYLGLNKLYYNLSHHNFFNIDNYPNLKKTSVDSFIYVQNPSINDSTLAPCDHSTMYITLTVPNTKSDYDWKELSINIRNEIVKLLQKEAKLDNIEEHIEFERIITPDEWEKCYDVGYGACFNLSHSRNQIMSKRPLNNFEEFLNMWLVGGGTNPGSSLPFVFESGRVTAHSILKKYNIKVPELFIPPVSHGYFNL
ncbi:phytoene desaturase family protein [Natranaerobius trueperi]|uniref:Phytoene desaturase n=1 Tax=Natranaerobius trueperi TaxID=759412 RepID=A0A226BVV0_9FIRM|nr:phytoene desaturase family protein [Natranaerobius trueperi]OWZ82902.1 phytoene desaturase [Natranaerobius trueperi]